MRWNAGRLEFPLSSMPVWPACAVKDAHVRDKPGYDDVYHNSKNFFSDKPCTPVAATISRAAPQI